MLSLLGSSLLQLPIWGFAMSYGVLQEYFTNNWELDGAVEITGTIGTTFNGVTYISMPILFALFVRRWSQWRRVAAISGTALLTLSLLASSFSTHVWHLLITQGIFAGIGSALIFSPTTLTLGEWHQTHNRAIAYGVTLSCKNVVGSACPFLFRVLLDNYGFRLTLRIWLAIATASSAVAITLIPPPPSAETPVAYRPRSIPWHFLRHRTFYVYSLAILLQSSGYGIPQTYLSTYAHDVAALSQSSATLLLTLFNIPGIVASYFFGYLSDSSKVSLSTSSVCLLSSLASALSAFLLWGMAANGSMAVLILFALIFGFFSGGYSAIWGGFINDMASEAAALNEAIDTGMVYGLLNGARGIGYVIGGLASLPLLAAGSKQSLGLFGYGSGYGPLIIFTGLTSAFGGWAVFWRTKRL